MSIISNQHQAMYKNENNITNFQQAFLYILVSMSNLLIVFTYKYHKTAIKGQLNL